MGSSEPHKHEETLRTLTGTTVQAFGFREPARRALASSLLAGKVFDTTTAVLPEKVHTP